ncbi:unnamed protein product [Arctogadus glacialis]
MVLVRFRAGNDTGLAGQRWRSEPSLGHMIHPRPTLNKPANAPRGLRAWARLAPAVPGPSVRQGIRQDGRPTRTRGLRHSGARASGELQPSGGLVLPLGRWAEAEPSTFVHTAPVCVPQKWTVVSSG